MWEKRLVYVLIAHYKEDIGCQLDPRELFAINRDKAEEKRKKLLLSGEYERVDIKPEPEEREFWIDKE